MIKLKRQKSHENSREIYLILDNIRSVHNVGSIFRTAETLGISKIFCIGTTPTPKDRFNRKRSDMAKVALGAEDLIPWEYAEDAVSLVKKLQKDKFTVIALEQNEKSIDYKEIKINKDEDDKLAIILGNEVTGVSANLLQMSDIIAEIPIRGKKESLNVSISAGIFLYRLLDK
jgi:tRNA G18 (ribose-2'-O)-methylase SpoU